MFIPYRIYYEKETGAIIQTTGNFDAPWLEEAPSIERDFETYSSLIERTRESVGVIELKKGEYAEDFEACAGVRVDPERGTLVFSYPDPDGDEAEEPFYRAPLSVEVDQLKAENAAVIMQVASLEMQNQQLAADQAGLLMQLVEKGVI